MGRSKKYETEFLEKIVEKYIEENNNIILLKNLAEYSNSILGIKDIRYYHFGRNDSIIEKINKYNEGLKNYSNEISNGNISFKTINVREFLNANYNNKERLIKFLNNIQNEMLGLYKKNIDREFEIKKLQEKLQKNKNTLKKYKEQINELNKKMNDYMKTISIYENDKMASALNGTNLYDLKIENELNDEVNNDELNDLQNILDKYDNIFENK